jgi:predicted phage replisome organizer
MDVKWIKIVVDIFDDEKILLIESVPEHDAIIVIWFKLLCLAGKMNNSGVFMMNNKFAYTDEMLSTILRRPLNTVRLALDTFEKFGMIERIENVITIPNWSKHQTLDQLESKKEYMRAYMQEYREKQKGLIGCKTCKTNSKTNVNSLDIDKDKEQDIDKESIRVPVPLDFFSTFWESYPRRESKEKTKQWFIKNKPNEELQTKILEALEKFKKTEQWQDKQFIPHPTTWLNQKRWEDEVIIGGNQKPNGKKVANLPDWYEKYENGLKDLPKPEEQPLSEEEMKKVLEEANKRFNGEVSG